MSKLWYVILTEDLDEPFHTLVFADDKVGAYDKAAGKYAEHLYDEEGEDDYWDEALQDWQNDGPTAESIREDREDEWAIMTILPIYEVAQSGELPDDLTQA